MAIEEITKLVEESVTSEVFGVWFLIGAALVFFMQAGFAMVETGFTRAKNAGNIIMKNLMDFCIGTVVFERKSKVLIAQNMVSPVLMQTFYRRLRALITAMKRQSM